MSDKDMGEERNRYLFQHLIAMFQTLALQQLGKLMNPISGKLERDLQQARITIDMLEMIRMKTEGNLDDDERRLLDSVLVELQLNFVDESNRDKEQKEKSEGTEAAGNEGAESSSGDDVEESAGEKTDESSAKKGEKVSEEDNKKGKKRKRKENGNKKE